MFCKECGKSISDDSKFCSYCGLKVDSKADLGRTIAASDDRDVRPKTAFPKADGGQYDRKEDKPEKLYRTANFVWDLDGFPTESKPRERKAEFNWKDTFEERTENKKIEHGDLFLDHADDEETDVSWKEHLFDKEPKIEKEDTSEVNKFYTFNKKNEEFQQLLDREYEKLKTREDFPLLIDDEGSAEATNAEEGTDIFEAANLLDRNEEDYAKEEVENGDFAGTQSGLDQVPEEKEHTNEGLEVVGVLQPLLPRSSIDRDTIGKRRYGTGEQGDYIGAKRPRGRGEDRKKTKFNIDAIFDDEHDNLDSRKIAFPKRAEKAKVEEDLEEYEDKRHPGIRALSIVFYVVLALVIVILGIKLIVPQSTAANKIEQGYDYVIGKITGKKEPAPMAEEQATGIDQWIANALKDNKIKNVLPDSNVKVDLAIESDFHEVQNSKDFTDSIWYTNDDGKNIRYGSQIIKSVVDYYNNEADESSKIRTLKIGEIRTAEFGFFVATLVSRNDEEGASQEVLDTLYIEPKGTVMEVSDILSDKGENN